MLLEIICKDYDVKPLRPIFYTAFQLGLLFIAATSLYFGALSAPLIFDDSPLFDDFALITARYSNLFATLQIRALSYATFSWTIQWLGNELYWLRLGNVLLHAATVLVLFGWLRRLFNVVLNAQSDPKMTQRLQYMAGLGALWFALHPVTVYGIAYLIQRPIVMATLFVVLMLWAYLEGLLRERWWWMLVAAGCYAAAVYSKEHSVAAPGVALALTLLVRRPSWRVLRQIAPFFVLATLIAASAVWNSKDVVGVVYEGRAGGMLEQAQDLRSEQEAAETIDESSADNVADVPSTYSLSVVSQASLFFKYVGLWLVPNPAWMSVDMREPLAMSIVSWYGVGALVFILYLGLAAWLVWQQGRHGLLGLAMLFPAVLFWSEFTTVRVQEAFVLYRSYLWMPGLALALPVLLGKLSELKLGLLALLITLLFVPASLNRIHTFSSSLTLWQDAEKLVRNKQDVLGEERIYFNYGNELSEKERYKEAIQAFNKAIYIAPKFDWIYANRAMAYRLLKQYPQAFRDYNRALELNPNDADYYYWRALLHREVGAYEAAMRDIRESCARGGECS